MSVIPVIYNVGVVVLRVSPDWPMEMFSIRFRTLCIFLFYQYMYIKNLVLKVYIVLSWNGTLDIIKNWLIDEFFCLTGFSVWGAYFIPEHSVKNGKYKISCTCRSYQRLISVNLNTYCVSHEFLNHSLLFQCQICL